MKLIKISLILAACLIFTNCTSKKVATSSTSVSMDSTMDKEMTKNGFKKGVIVHSSLEGDCPYVIKILEENDEQSTSIDPINLEESYMKDGKKVWIKYHGLRIMNRCDKATPASIEEIKKRTK